MLTITHDAATLLTSTRARMGAPEDYGVRLSIPEPDAGDATGLVLAFVPGPDPGDDVMEQQGIRAYVAPDASAELDDATLDVTPTNGTPPRLVLRRPKASGDAGAGGPAGETAGG
jgi:iron-sulfur cluster assembly protein